MEKLKILIEKNELTHDVIIAGDFNCDFSKKDTFISKSLKKMMKETKMHSIDLLLPQSFSLTYYKGETQSHLDHVLVKKRFSRIESVKIIKDGENIGDHLALEIIAELRTGGKPSKKCIFQKIGKRRHRWKIKLFHDRFHLLLASRHRELIPLMEQLAETTDPKTAQRLSSLLHKSLHEIMNWAANKTADDLNDKTIMRKNKTNGWYTDEVKEAKLDRIRKQELHELLDNDETAENLRQAKNNYRNLLRDSKNDYEHKEAVKLEQLRHLDQQSFWKIVRSKLKEKIEVECSIEQLKLEYSALFSERIADESYEANEAAKEVADFMKRTESENYADKAITFDELSKIISSLSNNKSIRPSGVSNEMIKHCESGVVLDRLLISKSLSLGTIPEDSNKAYIKPLIKDGSKLRDDIFPDHISSKISGQAEKIAQLDKLGFSLKSTNQLSKGFYYNTYVRSYLLHGADALVLS